MVIAVQTREAKQSHIKDSAYGLCCICGHSGAVHRVRYYIGGVGDVYRWICSDTSRCQKGLEANPLVEAKR